MESVDPAPRLDDWVALRYTLELGKTFGERHMKSTHFDIQWTLTVILVFTVDFELVS
jgi:hypothetical protein